MAGRVLWVCLGLLICSVGAAAEPSPAPTDEDSEAGIEQLLESVVEERLREVEPILRALDVSRVRVEQLLRLCGEQETADRLRETWWSNARRRISAAVDAYQPEAGRRDYLLRILTGVSSFELGISAALGPFVDDQACETALEVAAETMEPAQQ